MATPTPSKGALNQTSSLHGHVQGRTPGQASAASPSVAAGTPPYSTPMAAVMSTTPRAYRNSPQGAKKSLNALAGTLGGEGRPGAVSLDMPPAAVVMDGFAIQDLTLDSLSSALAEASGVPALKSDDPFAARLDALFTILRRHQGRVSENGLETYGRRFGFDCAWEDTTHDGRKARTLVVAGKILQLEISLENQCVVAVKAEFPMSSDLVRQHEARVGEILYRDLKLRPVQSPFTKKVARFAANFERIAAFDKFSSMPGLDLLEGPAGLYESLRNLYIWDLGRKRQDARYAGKDDYLVEKAVICEDHGRPVMNARDRVGLALQYWTEQRLLPAAAESDRDHAAKLNRTWSMLIGCAPFNGMFHVPVRCSADWISDRIEALPPTSAVAISLGGGGGAMLDWLEPPHMQLEGPAALGGTSIVQPDGSLSHEKYPSAMFVAIFDPPVVLPQGISQSLHALLGGADANMLEAYESLVLPPPADSAHIPGGLRHESIVRYSTVLPQQRGAPNSAPGSTVEVTTCKLSVTRGVYAHRLTEVPFAHPRQLVELMPVLRQYAFLATLLENSCGILVVGPTPRDEMDAEVAGAGGAHDSETHQRELAKFVDDSSPRWTYEVSIAVFPLPQLQIGFSMPSGEPARLSVEIRENGVPHISNQNLLPNDETGYKGIAARTTVNGKQLTVTRLAQQLAIVESIDGFCSWIRTRLG